MVRVSGACRLALPALLLGSLVGWRAAGAQAPAGTTEQVSLTPPCTNVALTWPSGTPITVVAAAIQPQAALRVIWRYDAAAERFQGFTPDPAAPSDLRIVNPLDAVFVCVTGAATLTRPALGIVAVAQTPQVRVPIWAAVPLGPFFPPFVFFPPPPPPPPPPPTVTPTPAPTARP